jgi:hypothetical protein
LSVGRIKSLQVVAASPAIFAAIASEAKSETTADATS